MKRHHIMADVHILTDITSEMNGDDDDCICRLLAAASVAIRLQLPGANTYDLQDIKRELVTSFDARTGNWKDK